MTQDLISLFLDSPAIPGAAARAGNFTGASVDTYEVGDGQMVLRCFGTATAVATIAVEESDTGVGAWAAVPAASTALGVANQVGAGLAVPISTVETMYEGNFMKNKRFIRAIITGTGHSLAGCFSGKRKYVGN